MRGTTGYWQSKMKQGYAFGNFCEYYWDQMPTVFCTISAAEMHWKWLHRLLPGSAAYLDDDAALSERDQYRLRSEAVIQNPLIVAWAYRHFNHVWFMEVLYKHAGWEDHFTRFEFAARGATHSHTLARLRGAPTISAIEDVQAEITLLGDSSGPLATALMAWYMQHVGLTAWYGGDPESDPVMDSAPLRKALHELPQNSASLYQHLCSLCGRLQVHVHSEYCLRPDGKGGYFCRVGYGEGQRRACVCEECQAATRERVPEEALANMDPAACESCHEMQFQDPPCW